MRLPALPPTPAVNDSSTTVPAVARAADKPATPALAAHESSDNAAVADAHALRELVDKLSQTIGTTGQQVQFSIDQDSHRTVLRVTDAESGAVLRQIPGDEALSMARILDRMQGILISQKA